MRYAGAVFVALSILLVGCGQQPGIPVRRAAGTRQITKTGRRAGTARAGQQKQGRKTKEPFLTVLQGFDKEASPDQKRRAREESQKFRKRLFYGTDEDNEIRRGKAEWTRNQRQIADRWGKLFQKQ